MSNAFVTNRLRRLPSCSAFLVLAALSTGCTINSTNYYDSTPAKEAGSKGSTSSSSTKTPSKSKPAKSTPAKPTPAKPTPAKPTPGTTTPATPDKPASGSTDTPKPTSPPPAPEVSRIVVPVRVPFETLIERIDSLLPKTQSQDYKRVTKEGQSPQVDVKYKAWRDPITATFSGKTLKVVVPIRYAANIRAKVKNPLGSDWITVAEDETWGTAAHPQRMKVTIELALGIDDNWKVTSVSKLDGISHSKAPSGNFCAKVGINVCTSKENLAPTVQSHLNDYLVPKIQDGLKKADAEVAKAFDLQKRAQSVWAALQAPQQIQKANDKTCPTLLGAACKQDAWLLFTPAGLGMTQLMLEGDDLGVDLSLEGKIVTVLGKKPAVKTKALPKLEKPVGPTEFQLRTSLELPLSTLSADAQKALGGASFSVGSSKLELENVGLAIGSDKVVTLSITTKGAHAGKLVAKAKLTYDAKKALLELSSLEFDAATEALFKNELKGLDEAALKKKLAAALTIDLSSGSVALQRAVTAGLNKALPGKLTVKGTLSDVSIVDLAVADGAVDLHVELVGSLAIEYVP